MEKHLAGVDSDTQNHRRWAAGKFNFEGAAYTDAAGGPKWVHPSVRKAGSAAALLQWRQDDAGDWLVQNVGIIASSVSGKQTVPRSEVYAGSLLPSSTNAQINEWHSDCKYVVNGTSHPEALRKFCMGDV